MVAAASGRAASPPLVAEGAAGAAAASAGGRQASAATLVQSVWRGYTDRRKLSDLMEDLGYFDEGGEFSLADFHYVCHAPCASVLCNCGADKQSWALRLGNDRSGKRSGDAMLRIFF